MRIRNRTRAFEWNHFLWPWVSSNADFKVTALFDAEHLWNGMSLGTYTCCTLGYKGSGGLPCAVSQKHPQHSLVARSLTLKFAISSDIDLAEHLLLQRQLRWLGYVIVICMSSNCLPFAFCTRNYSTGSGCQVAQSCTTGTTSVVSWTSLKFLSLIWKSLQLTQTVGQVFVPAAWTHTARPQIKQLKNDAVTGTIHPSQRQLVLDVRSVTESVPPSSVCTAIFAVTRHVPLNTPSSTNVIIDLDGLLQASKQAFVWPWVTKQNI